MRVIKLLPLFIAVKGFSVGFVTGTEVTTQGAKCVVNAINPADCVMAYSNAQNVLSQTTDCFSDSLETLVITTADGVTVQSSEDQRYYSSGSWKKAKHLEVGDLLTREDHSQVSIIDIEVGLEEEVFTFEVVPCHTFFANGVLVHNPYENPTQCGAATAGGAIGGAIGGAAAGGAAGGPAGAIAGGVAGAVGGSLAGYGNATACGEKK